MTHAGTVCKLAISWCCIHTMANVCAAGIISYDDSNYFITRMEKLKWNHIIVYNNKSCATNLFDELCHNCIERLYGAGVKTQCICACPKRCWLKKRLQIPSPYTIDVQKYFFIHSNYFSMCLPHCLCYIMCVAHTERKRVRLLTVLRVTLFSLKQLNHTFNKFPHNKNSVNCF